MPGLGRACLSTRSLVKQDSVMEAYQFKSMINHSTLSMCEVLVLIYAVAKKLAVVMLLEVNEVHQTSNFNTRKIQGLN